MCGRTNPITQPRCINCGQRAQGVLLVAEETPPVSAWWTGSTRNPGSIPPPPQVKEEAARAETVTLDLQKRQIEKDRRAAAARDQESRIRLEREAAGALARSAVTQIDRQIAVRSQAVLQADCARCGVPLETTAEGGFSFCLRCGAESPQVRTAAPILSEAATQTTASRTVVTATTVGVAERSAGISPRMAGAVSFVVPGIGQILNGQIAKGVLLLLLTYVVIVVIGMHPLGLVALAARGIAAIDAARIAEQRRKGAAVRDGEWNLG